MHNIYMSMAQFSSPSHNTPLDLSHQISLLAIAMITSKARAA
jgi:Na+/H+-dicarboxylate symporter